MPKIFVHTPAQLFNQQIKTHLSQQMIAISLQEEGLPITDVVKNTAWVYFREYTQADIFIGGEATGNIAISIEVNYFKGALDDEGKGNVIRRYTQTVLDLLKPESDKNFPLYIFLNEVDTANWGIGGGRTTLEELKNN